MATGHHGKIPAVKAKLQTNGRSRNKDIFSLDAFVSQVYMPHIRLRKRSWALDERVTRKHLSPVFGERELASIKRYEVESWLHYLADNGLAASTINRIMAVFKSVCSLAIIHGLISAGQSPCAGISSIRDRNQKERYLTVDEARKLMRALEKSKRIEAFALRLLLLTGARKSEVLKARWENVRLDLNLLVVPLSKSGKPRHILLSKEALAIIKSLQSKPGCPWLFPGHSPGKPLSDIFLFWRELRRELGLEDVRIHDLRHTFASLLVNSGHSLYEAQRMLGHCDPRTTMRYAHLGQASLLAAAETVSGFVSSQKKNDRQSVSGRILNYRLFFRTNLKLREFIALACGWAGHGAAVIYLQACKFTVVQGFKQTNLFNIWKSNPDNGLVFICHVPGL